MATKGYALQPASNFGVSLQEGSRNINVFGVPFGGGVGNFAPFGGQVEEAVGSGTNPHYAAYNLFHSVDDGTPDDGGVS